MQNKPKNDRLSGLIIEDTNMMRTTEIQLVHYLKSGMPTADDFKRVTIEIPPLKPNEILVRNQWMSVDPYMRGRMIQRTSYVPPFELNESLQGHAIGVVESSTHSDFSPGDIVSSMNGWQEYFIATGMSLRKSSPTTFHCIIILVSSVCQD